MADQVLDARGLNCPLPILKTKKAINKMESGQVLEVLSTDAGSVKDLEAFCNQTGNKLLETVEDDGKYTFTIEKAWWKTYTVNGKGTARHPKYIVG